MLVNLGQGMRGHGSAFNVAKQVYQLTSALPSFLTYTRSDTTAMYRTSTGNWAKAASNTAFFHHDLSGNPLGLWIEPARTNKCTNVNWQMADMTGLTAPAGGVSVSTHPIHGFPTILIDNAGGGGTKYANISGTFANLNPHSMQVQYYVETGTGQTAFLNDSGGALTSVTGSLSHTAGMSGEIKVENFTPTNTGRTMRISVSNGGKIHFWCNSLEEALYCTNPIYCNGASGSRVQSRVYCTDLTLLGKYYRQSAGTLGLVAYVPSVTNVDMLPAIYSDGTTGNTIGLRLFTDGFVRPNVTVAGSAQGAQSVNRAIAGREFPMALTWRGSAYRTIAGAGRTRREAAISIPSISMTRLDIGSRYNGSQGFFGGIKKLLIANGMLTNQQIGAELLPAGSRGIISVGQSLIDNLRRSDVDQNNNGEVAFNAQLDATWSATAGKNWLLHGAIGGAGVLYKNTTGGAWYYNDATGAWGDAWQYTQDVLDFFQGGGGTVEGIIFDGAQQDAGAVALTGQDYTDVYNGIKGIISKIRGIVGSNIPAVIMPTTGRTDVGLQERYQYLRELQWALAGAETAYHRGPETFDLPKGDVVHLSAAGYTTSGSRSSRKMLAVLGAGLTGVNGAGIVSAIRTGTSLVVTLSHDIGTDFTPTTGIEGFYYTDGGGTQVTISAAARTNATTITLTLASGVAGTLYYGYGWLYGVTQANLVKDNATNSMPLRGAKISVS